MINNEFEKKKVWVVTVWLKDTDEDGNELDWDSSSEEHYADTREEAEEMKRRYIEGRDEFYGDLVEDVDISDEMEEREVLKLPAEKVALSRAADAVHLDP